jgi:hypothetical protein
MTTAQLALVTDSGQLHDALAWVVTFSWDQSVDMCQGPPGCHAFASHHHVVIDATTGKLLLGFETA